MNNELRLIPVPDTTCARKTLPDGRPWGWCAEKNIELFNKYCNAGTRCVIDGGSFLGLSASELYKAAPNAQIICVDHWRGSAEHHRPGRSDIADVIDNLFGVFCANIYDKRDRIRCLKAGSVEGMKWLYREGFRTEVVYIDWSHDLQSVYDDTRTALACFPNAVLIFDDWQRKGVHGGAKKAIRESLTKRNLIEYPKCAVLEA